MPAQTKQKVLQLYRSNEIYATKLLAQWMTIGYIDEYTATHEDKDGEPIIARYYDDLHEFSSDVVLDWVAFVPTSNNFETNLTNHGITILTGNGAPTSGDYEWSDTPLYKDLDGGKFYRLAWSREYEDIDKLAIHISTTFGVFYDNEDDEERIKTIEWFDNAKEINEVLDGLDYDDKTSTDNGDHQLVSEVNQLNGLVSARHTTLIVDPSLDLTESGSYDTDTRKLEHKIRIQSNVGSGNEVYEYVEHTMLDNVDYTDAASLPTATANSATYIHNTTDSKYYYKRSIVNQILYTDANGLNAKVYIKRVTPEDADANNVREQYALFGADGNRISNSADIKIYKDNALVKAYLGYMEDELVGAWVNGNTKVYTNQGTTIEAGTNITVYSNPECTTALTGTGTISIEETSTYGSRIILTHNNVVYTISEADITHKASTASDLTDALCFIYRQADDTYTLVAIDVEDFLSENEFGDGLQVNEPTKYYENMGSYSAMPNYPGTSSTSGWVADTNYFTDYDAAAQAAFAAVTEPYILVGSGSGTDAYVVYQLAGSNKGKIVSVKITNGVRNNYLKVDFTGIDTKMYDITSSTDDGSTGLVDGRSLRNYLNISGLAEETPEVMTGITVENGHLEKVTRTLHVNGRQLVVGTTQSGTDNDTLTVTIYEQDVNVADGSTPIEGNVTDMNGLISKTLTDPTESGTTQTTPYVEYNGVIYHWNGSAYEPFEIGNDTNGAVAFAILNYMAYTLDMGKYDTPTE